MESDPRRLPAPWTGVLLKSTGPGERTSNPSLKVTILYKKI